MIAEPEVLRAEIAPRLSPARLAHVEAVARTTEEIATGGGWPAATVEAAVRAAWIHDAVKDENPDQWLRRIEEAGWEPDAWALAHAPQLLHAQAAAAWARSRGETDSEVLDAVRHHPTGHPAWGVIGRVLYVADFTEPTRSFADEARSAEIRALASAGASGLARAARRVLRLRIRWLLEQGLPVHPLSIEAWNDWATENGR